MALEIRELVVKVSVLEEQTSQSQAMNEKERSKLIRECVRQVIKQLKAKKQR